MFRPGRPVCIVNPSSAGGRTGARWARLRYELERRVGPADCLVTGRRGEAAELAREAASKGATLVIAVGGDGTISEVVNGLMLASGRDADLALGIVPAGTGGDLARSLGLPSDPVAALRLLAEGRPRPLDVGRIEMPGPGGTSSRRYFVNIASAGIEGDVDRKMDGASRRLGGAAAYLWATLSAGMTFRPARVLMRAGDVELRRKVLSVVVANGRFFGGGMEIAPSARLDDGRFEVVVVRDMSLWRLALEAPRLYNGTIYRARGVEHFTATTLELESEDGQPVLLGIDGEPFGQLPARFVLEPSALRVIAAG
jgi:diacylglycerol kinase (ATP)